MVGGPDATNMWVSDLRTRQHARGREMPKTLKPRGIRTIHRTLAESLRAKSYSASKGSRTLPALRHQQSHAHGASHIIPEAPRSAPKVPTFEVRHMGGQRLVDGCHEKPTDASERFSRRKWQPILNDGCLQKITDPRPASMAVRTGWVQDGALAKIGHS
mmetsp:Transcript_32955/g.77100  ORF Transcript_32955/g.77100 Transcript_32955/m.77100 type:complete len:159 (-) Transcript_32955:61-537(-)